MNAVMRWAVPESRGAPDGMLLLPTVVILAAVGGLVSARRPDNLYGWILAAIGFLWGASGLIVDYGTLAAARDLPLSDAVVAFSSGAGAAAWGTFITFGLLLYPTGRLPGRRWRLIGLVSGAALLLLVVGAAWMSLQLGATKSLELIAQRQEPSAPGAARVLHDVGQSVVFLSMYAAVFGLFVRVRRASTVERLQLKWFAFGAVLLPMAIFGRVAERFGAAGPVLEIVAVTALPAAIGTAILRWRLYDIDRIVSRAVAYTILTALLIGIYLAAVTTLTRLTEPVTQDSPVAVAAATLLAAAAFQPARRRIQAEVDRRFNRARYDAAKTVESYRARLRDQVQIESLTSELVTAAADAVQPSAVCVSLRPVAGGRGTL